MQVMRDVLIDLWQFTCEELGMRAQPSPYQSPVVTAPTEQKVASPSTTPTLPTMTSAPSSIDTIPDSESSFVPRIMYVAYPETTCYLRPALVVDTIIGVFSYGTPVTVLSQRDDWVHVQTSGLEGWVERYALTSHTDDVLPRFAVGETYDAEHPDTIKLRTYIDDTFGTRILRCPLLGSEYVWYRLVKEGSAFSWPQVRPRSPGRWSEILRTEPTAHCGSVPMTGSIMEYTDQDHQGELYYVEAVAPDESLVVSGFSGAADGVFTRRTLTRDEWSPLQPRFICKK